MDWRPETANVFDLDPGLLEHVPEDAVAAVRARGAVVVLTTGRGVVDFGSMRPPGGFGLLVVRGLFTRAVAIAGRSSLELLGPGDVLRPWDDSRAGAPVPIEAQHFSLEQGRLALLDRRFATAVVAVPQIAETLVERLTDRSRWLALLLLIGRLPWVDARIVVLFWHLADRWGHVASDGRVVLPIRLTHATIGALVSAQRPTVTSALNQLVREGTLSKDERGWILNGPPPEPADLRREAVSEALKIRKGG